MTIKELKEFILKNNKVAYVLESIGCHHVKYHPGKGFWSCGNIDGDNVGAINVYESEYLLVQNWTRAIEFDGMTDIITLTQYNKKCSFVDAVKFLCNVLGISFDINKESEPKKPKFNPLAIFEDAISMKSKVDVAEIRELDEEILDEYTPMLHIDWFREGIMPWARDKFGICYSYKRSRIVIPHRHWLTGKLVGMNMRTTVANYDEFGISKYYLSPGMNKSANLYGLFENYDSIQEAGYVILLEGEKSVLKMYSKDGHENEEWMNKYGFNGKACVALSGKNISDEQVRILIGLNVEIIVALDKDVDINEVRCQCEKFYNIRNVSYMYDKHNRLLGEKDSPADVSNEKIKWLFRLRKSYDESEHKAYLKSLKN